MLRAARLLLVASAAASVGLVAIIATRASAFAPIVLLFVAAAVLFALATTSLEVEPRRGKLLAAAAALVLAAMGTLAGFGSGDVTFPAAGLGVIAAWLAALWRGPRRLGWAFLAYVAIGVALDLWRVGALFALPWSIPGILLWPVSSTFFISPAGAPIAIYGAFGIACALVITAYSRPLVFRVRPDPRTVMRDAIAGGLLFVGIEAVLALTRPNTSARAELVPLAVAVMFGSAALLVAGLRLLRASVPGGVIATVVGAALVLYIATARPTVECSEHGGGTSSGPWWLPYGGGISTSGSVSSESLRAPSVSSGEIKRTDGVTITYRCVGGLLEGFEVRR